MRETVLHYFNDEISKTAKYGFGVILKGLRRVPKRAPLGEKVWGAVVKGSALGGAGYGGYKLYKNLSRPRSKQDYTTFLRNNIIAGNIKPEELTSTDLESVKKLGLR